LKLGIRGKLFVVSLALIALMALTSGLFVETVMRGLLVDRVSAELEHLTRSTSELVELAPGELAQGSMQGVIERLGRGTSARITLIAPDGRVLADSAVRASELSALDNHADRPEVRLARSEGRGVVARYSDTVGAEMMYMALPFKRAEASGFVRVAMTLGTVDALITRMRWAISGAVLLGVVVAGGMGMFASHIASRSLLDLVGRARAMASGMRSSRMSEHVGDELSGLAVSFNRIADELDRTVRTLSEERDRSQAVLDSLTDAVISLDAKACISDVNRAGLKLLSRERAPVGQPMLDVLRVPSLVEIVEHAQRGETAHAEVVWHGSPRRTLLVTAAPQRSKGQCVLVLRDVTELRRLESMRRDFVANVSHELRTPVSIISANVETLLAGAFKDPVRAPEFLSAVQRNAERLTRLVSDLLDLSRIEAGQRELTLSLMTAEEPIGAVIDLLETRAQERGLSLVVEVEDDLEFAGEEHALEQVLVNLVDNAIKYTPSGGEIGLGARAEGDYAVFEVWDTGPGVPEAHRARLFERFYRVDPGRSRDMGGTGLGLSIVKHLVEAMRGQVGMRPREGGGSTFWVRLPRTVGRRSLVG
jgi:two-component system, OmpR family, phosphate regulon sensor histidine kinase PhoR